MRLVSAVASTLFALTLLTNEAAAQSHLAAARSEIADEKESKPSSSRDDSSDDESRGSFVGGLVNGLFSGAANDNCSSGATELSSSMILGIATAPWSIPRSILLDEDRDGYFGDYPFSDDRNGYIVDQLPQPEWTRRWAGRFTSEYGSNFDGLSKTGGRLQLETTQRFGIDIEWDRRREELFAGHDTLWTGDANLVYRFAQSQHAVFYTGLGLNWSADHSRSDFGFNFTYGADFFPVRNVVVSSTLDIGRLGHSTLIHGRATIGYFINRFEVFTGFDYYKVGGAELNGMVSGVRLWF